MKKLAAFICFFMMLASGPASAAISLVTSTIQSLSPTSSIDTTDASLIVVGLAWYNSAPPANLTDSKGNTWTALTSQSANGGFTRLQFFYCSPCVVGSSHTFSSSNGFVSIGVMAFSGTAVLSPLDQQNGSVTSSTTTIQPGSVTPSQNNELVITAFGTGNFTSQSVSIDSGFSTPITNSETTSAMILSMSYLIQTTATAKNPTWTVSSSLNNASTIATFKAASVATPPSVLMGIQ